ncbi:MAG: hypothetical protein HYU27_05285 [Acidobacteria bacterium]|nr:hypothetical protein [Acidobacteriota bacterium]
MHYRIFAVTALLVFFGVTGSGIQARQRGRATPPATAKAGAPLDVTGTWVPLITEDWRHRMVTPKKGDYESVPLTAEGRQVADTWDPAKDETAGEQCQSYGAPAIMRMAGRVRITWDSDNALKVETEAGSQTRLFHFGNVPPPAGAATWQGHSIAGWDAGSLKVVTNRLRPGYLRKNGVPYSANAGVTEWYDRVTSPNGDDWLIVTTEVVDPQYLAQPFITSTHFKKLPDGATFTREACSAR